MDLKLKEKCRALQKFASKSSEPENLQVLEPAHTGKLGDCTASQILRKGNLKKVGIVAGSGVVVLSALHLTGQYRFYHSVVAKELKKQLSPLYEKLDALQAQNQVLQAELAKLQPEEQTPETID